MRIVATVGGIGRVPRLPGTTASLVGVGISWLLSAHPSAQAAACFAAVMLGFWSAGPTAASLGLKDPSMVVIDEVAGMMLGLVLLPATGPVYLAGFFLFRLLDILKPGPIRRLERLSGGFGIMADDLLAGLLTNGLLHFALRLM